ncbi:MAG: HDIG domain-containing protein [Candidatus Delongbacteria bacterium]|nr:HDIG domain-containing protein [Candidatus Delongbacteria bacterium]
MKKNIRSSKASDLGSRFSPAAFHAGLDTLRRKYHINLLFYILIAFYVLMVYFISPVERKPNLLIYKLDDVVDRDIIAEFDFPILKNADELKAERDNAEKKVYAVYQQIEEMEENKTRHIRRFFAALRTKSRDSLLRVIGLSADPDSVAPLLTKKNLNMLEENLIQAFSTAYRNGLCRDIKDVTKNAAGEIITIKNSLTREAAVTGLSDEKSLIRSIQKKTDGFVQGDKIRQDFVYQLTMYFFEPNLIFDETQTNLLKEQARNSIPVSRGYVKKGEKIIGKHERIAADIFQKLISHQQMVEKDQGNGLNLDTPFFPEIAKFFIILSMVIAYLVSIFFYDPVFFHRQRNLILLMILTFVPLFLLSIVIQDLPSMLYFLPIPTFIILISIFTGSTIALISSFYLAVLFGIFLNMNYHHFYVFWIVMLVSCYSVQTVRKRKDFYWSMIMIPAAYVFVLLLDYINLISYEGSLWLNLTYGACSGFLSPIIAIGLLPLFESIFSITTDLTLLELSDLNHPLLQKMAVEAPGTYNHSLIVGNLAESAAKAIHANSLKARVGSYFHDIGKINKSEYFIENQSGENRHDRLSPTMSSLIISSHVREGIELAKKYKLPVEIQEIIQEHHGKTLIKYFYKKAVDQNIVSDGMEEEFKYPGPRPRSKEAAIVMLADSIEAASRTLKNPTVSRLKTLINEMIKEKFITSELDECSLTFKDLSMIGEAFLIILSGRFHARIDYPDSPANAINHEDNHQQPES